MSSTTQDTRETISDWLGDIVALESHVEEAMDRQLSIESSNTQVATAFKRFHDTVRDSKRRAVAYQESYGTTSGNPVVKAGANLLGKAAGMLDKIRNDAASKALRDDYTAYNHVAIAYTMLHTTALAYNDAQTAAFAQEGLTTYAGLVQEINHLIPDAVIADLGTSDDSPQPASNTADESRMVIDTAWKKTSNS